VSSLGKGTDLEDSRGSEATNASDVTQFSYKFTDNLKLPAPTKDEELDLSRSQLSINAQDIDVEVPKQAAPAGESANEAFKKLKEKLEGLPSEQELREQREVE